MLDCPPGQSEDDRHTSLLSKIGADPGPKTLCPNDFRLHACMLKQEPQPVRHRFVHLQHIPYIKYTLVAYGDGKTSLNAVDT